METTGAIESQRNTGCGGRRWLERTVSAATLVMTVFLMHPDPVRAQQQPSTPATASELAIAFDIPAQDLNAALLTFTNRAGLQVFYDVTLVKGLRSAQLKGTFTPAQGLAQLLAGSGITYRFTGANTVSLEKRSSTANEAVQLGPIRIEGELIDAQSPYGPGVGYVATRSATGTKSDTPIIETPQTINVITRDQIDEQGAETIPEALRYTPGVVSEPRGIQSYADTLYSRGFAIDEYWNGLRLIVGNFAVPQIDPHNLERIEILKGPGSVLYGQASPGGVANLVSKRPLDKPYHELELTGGSFGQIQGAFDLSGPLDQDGTVLYRITGLGRDAGTQVDHTEVERFNVSPALTWRPDDKTAITFLVNLQRDPEGGYSGFLPADGTVFKNAQGKRFPLSFYDGNTNFNTFKRTQGSLSYLFEHKLDQDWTVRQNFRYIHTDVNYENVFSFGYTDDNETDLTLYGRRSKERLDAVTVDNQIEGKFSTGSIGHTLLVGVDYQRSMWHQKSGGDFVGTLNVSNPDNSQSIDAPPYDTMTYEVQDQIGVYAQDQLRFGNWRLLLGGREDWAFSSDEDKIANTTTNQQDRKFSGRAGVVYHFDSGFAPYISYATSFQPTVGTDAAGVAFKPTTGQQEEVGIKYQPKGGNSFVTVSAFNLTQQNVLTTDPNNPSFDIQTGEIRSRGVEVEGKANLSEGLNVIVAYSYMANVVTKANDGTEGKTPVFMPKNKASLWLDYLFGKSSSLPGIQLGGGVRFVGTTYGDAANSFKVPSYTLFDAAVSYDFGAMSQKLEGVKLLVNATNLADTKYVPGCVNSLFCTYGERRKILATLRYQW